MSETFSEADLEPSREERGRARADVLDRAAATVAALAAGLVVGGMLALGACAAPFVFRLTPAPQSGFAMGAAFARFDGIAIGAACVVLGAEVLRTWLARRSRPVLAARMRRLAAIGFAGATTLMGLSVSPAINELHAAGAQRGVGDAGQRLEAIHRRAELVGRVEAVLGAAIVALHVFTLRGPGRAEEDEEDDGAPAPLPPGPRE